MAINAGGAGGVSGQLTSSRRQDLTEFNGHSVCQCCRIRHVNLELLFPFPNDRLATGDYLILQKYAYGMECGNIEDELSVLINAGLGNRVTMWAWQRLGST